MWHEIDALQFVREELQCQSTKSLHKEDSLISLEELWKTWIRSEGECRIYICVFSFYRSTHEQPSPLYCKLPIIGYGMQLTFISNILAVQALKCNVCWCGKMQFFLQIVCMHYTCTYRKVMHYFSSASWQMYSILWSPQCLVPVSFFN